jgi:hypothetical protein
MISLRQRRDEARTRPRFWGASPRSSSVATSPRHASARTADHPGSGGRGSQGRPARRVDRRTWPPSSIWSWQTPELPFMAHGGVEEAADEQPLYCEPAVGLSAGLDPTATLSHRGTVRSAVRVPLAVGGNTRARLSGWSSPSSNRDYGTRRGAPLARGCNCRATQRHRMGRKRFRGCGQRFHPLSDWRSRTLNRRRHGRFGS